MSEDPGCDAGDKGKFPAPDTAMLLRRNPGKVLLIVIVLAATSGIFAYVGGFLTPHRLGANRFIDAMEAGAGGSHPGFRRAHSKGLCIAGSFIGAVPGRTISKAAVFDGARIPVTGRFAEAAPDPFARDSSEAVRSMALRLQPRDAPEWRMAINDTPGLHVSTPQAFYENVLASTPDPANGKPNPVKMQAFLAAHPETVAFMARMKARKLPSGFANDTYNSVDGFIFVASDNARRLVRWSMEAEEPFAMLSEAARAAKPANYMFDDLLARVSQGPIKWRLVATLALPGDPNRAASVWPADRPRVVMGELTIDRVESEMTGNCQDINFDPLVLPPGIAPSDDPMPFARSAIYSVSFRRRASEQKPPSAVTNKSAGATS